METNKSMMTMKLVKFWDFGARSYYRDGHFTTEGIETYWKSIDSAIEFWQRNLAPGGSTYLKRKPENKIWNNPKNLKNPDFVPSFFKRNQFQVDRFHWKQKNCFGEQIRRLLPPPTYRDAQF